MSRTTFRTLLIVNWALGLAAFFANALDARYIPPDVRHVVNEAIFAEMSSGLGLYYLLACLCFFLYLISTVGLFAFKRFARPLFVAYLVAGFVIGLIPPLWLMARPYRIVGGLSSLSTVLIFTLIY